MTSKSRVFISHTTRDQRDHSLAQQLAAGVRERGGHVWIAPNDIPSGAEWQAHIVAAVLEHCSHFLVIVSAASASAPWVLEEIRLAEARRRADPAFGILPLFVGETGPFKGSEFLNQFQKVPFFLDVAAQLDAVVTALNMKGPTLNRREFVRDVGELFTFFGYRNEPAAVTPADQPAFYAESQRSNRSNLLVACAFRDTPSARVTTAEVQRFATVVATERMNGTVDRAYLVTNTGFAAEARDFLAGQPQRRYLSLVSYDELLQSLLDSKNYLEEFVAEYEKKRRDRSFVDLRALEMCGFPATNYEATPGDRVEPSSVSWVDFNTDGIAGIVLPGGEVARLIGEGLAHRHANSGVISLDFDRVSVIASERAAVAAANERLAAAEKDFRFVESLLSTTRPISPQHLQLARDPAANPAEAERWFADIWRETAVNIFAYTLNAVCVRCRRELERFTPPVPVQQQYLAELRQLLDFSSDTTNGSGEWVAVLSAAGERREAREQWTDGLARFQTRLEPLQRETWDSALARPLEPMDAGLLGHLADRFTGDELEGTINQLVASFSEFASRTVAPAAHATAEADVPEEALWDLRRSVAKWLVEKLDELVELVTADAGEGVRRCQTRLTLDVWRTTLAPSFSRTPDGKRGTSTSTGTRSGGWPRRCRARPSLGSGTARPTSSSRTRRSIRHGSPRG